MILNKRNTTILASLIILLCFTPQAFGFNLESAQAYNKALDLYIKGNTTDAIKEFEKAVKLDPEFADAYYNLGSIYRYTGDLNKAEEAFQKVLSINNNDTSVNYDLGLIYIQKKDYKKALSFLKLVNQRSDKYRDAQLKIKTLTEEMKINDIVADSGSAKDTTVVARKEITKNETISTDKTKTENNITLKNNDKENIEDKLTVEITENKNVASAKSDKKPAENTKSMSKRERALMSKALATNEFVEKEDNRIKEETIESEVITKQETTTVSTASKTQNTDKFWEKYSTASSSRTPNNNQYQKKETEEEKIAVSFMSIEDTSSSGKLIISPKSTLEKVSQVSYSSKPVARSAVKTFAKGFNGPTGIVSDNNNNVYVANYSENIIYKISPSGHKSVFAKSEDINGPIGLAIDPVGNLYVANYLSNSIALVDKQGDTSTIVTGLNKPYYLYFDNNDSLFVSEQETNTISKINLADRRGSR